MSIGIDRPGVSSDRIFYSGMAVASAVIVAIGFSATFYLRDAAMGPLSTLLTVHGVVFTAWIALLLTQTSLIAADRRDLHRKLGVVGVALAVAMIVLGMMASIKALALGRTPVPGLDPRSFFAIPFRDISLFTALVLCAVWMRRDAQSHKRLMILATIAILPAAIARWPIDFIQTYGPPAFLGLQALIVVAGMVYDYATRGAVHRAYKWGGALIILSGPAFLAISGTPPWLAFADWILRI